MKQPADQIDGQGEIVETGDAVIQIQQIYQRHLKIGQPVELAFKTRPGRVYNGKVMIRVESSLNFINPWL